MKEKLTDSAESGGNIIQDLLDWDESQIIESSPERHLDMAKAFARLQSSSLEKIAEKLNGRSTKEIVLRQKQEWDSSIIEAGEDRHDPLIDNLQRYADSAGEIGNDYEDQKLKFALGKLVSALKKDLQTDS